MSFLTHSFLQCKGRKLTFVSIINICKYYQCEILEISLFLIKINTLESKSVKRKLDNSPTTKIQSPPTKKYNLTKDVLDLNLKEIKEQLKIRGLKVSGTQAELIAILKNVFINIIYYLFN